jgi:hypothetical protein
MQISAENAERVLKASPTEGARTRKLEFASLSSIRRPLESISLHGWGMAWSDRCGHKRKGRHPACSKWKRKSFTTTAKQGQMRMELSSPMATS